MSSKPDHADVARDGEPAHLQLVHRPDGQRVVERDHPVHRDPRVQHGRHRAGAVRPVPPLVRPAEQAGVDLDTPRRQRLAVPGVTARSPTRRSPGAARRCGDVATAGVEQQVRRRPRAVDVAHGHVVDARREHLLAEQHQRVAERVEQVRVALEEGRGAEDQAVDEAADAGPAAPRARSRARSRSAR